MNQKWVDFTEQVCLQGLAKNQSGYTDGCPMTPLKLGWILICSFQ